MFPCKVKFENLDKSNKKVKDVDLNGNKAITKGKIKKVATKISHRQLQSIRVEIDALWPLVATKPRLDDSTNDSAT